MRNLTLAIAILASFGLSTAALAGEGNAEPFPNDQNFGSVTVQAQTADVGGASYPAPNPKLSTKSTGAQLLPANGSNGIVETANSLPAGAMAGTAHYAQAQSTARYYASRRAHGFAQARAAAQPHS